MDENQCRRTDRYQSTDRELQVEKRLTEMETTGIFLATRQRRVEGLMWKLIGAFLLSGSDSILSFLKAVFGG